MSLESRQAEIVKDDIAKLSVVLIGLGTAGSWAVPLLIKLGVGSLEVWDNDEVESGNVSCQAFSTNLIGRPKAHALQQVMAFLSADPGWLGRIEYHQATFELSKKLPTAPDIVISCVDTWKGRRDALDWAKGTSQAYIEARMMGRLSIVHAIDPRKDDDIKWIEATFGEDGKEQEIPCGLRGTAFLGAFTGAQIAGLVANVANGEAMPRENVYNLAIHQPIAMEN
jgi:molybdopterin/thiamine biosynthesis adenylyltransferase